MEISKEKLISKFKEICNSPFYMRRAIDHSGGVRGILDNPVVLTNDNMYVVKPTDNVEICLWMTSEELEKTQVNKYFLSILYKGFLRHTEVEVTEQEFIEMSDIHQDAEQKYRSGKIKELQELCDQELRGIMSFVVDENGKMHIDNQVIETA